MIDVLVWCSSRELFIKGMCETLLPDKRPLATYDAENDRLIPVEGVMIDEIGPITKADAVTDPKTGKELTPAVIVDGHHVNMRATGAIAQMLLSNGLGGTLPQVDKTGKPLGLFQRTNLRMLINGLEWKEITAKGVPGGYEGPNGVRLYDPATINSQKRVWL